VKNALRELGPPPRKGISVVVIKKHIASKYPEIDMPKFNRHLKRYFTKGVDDGELIRVSGQGASGSFKLGKEVKPKKKEPATGKKKDDGAVAKKAAPKASSGEKGKVAKAKPAIEKKPAPKKAKAVPKVVKTPVKKAASAVNKKKQVTSKK